MSFKIAHPVNQAVSKPNVTLVFDFMKIIWKRWLMSHEFCPFCFWKNDNHPLLYSPIPPQNQALIIYAMFHLCMWWCPWKRRAHRCNANVSSMHIFLWTVNAVMDSLHNKPCTILLLCNGIFDFHLSSSNIS